MKRTALWATFVVLMTTASYAADTGRYFVATRRPIREIGVNSVTRQLRDAGERRVRTFEIVHGFTADLTAAEAASLRNSPDVRYVEPVVSRHLLANVSRPGQQITPYGIALVHAPETWAGRISGEVNVAVIDSGIDNTHSELRGAYVGGYNVLEPEKAPMDGVGHGTHVSGTIAATNNNLGVVGVAPNVRLWGVKAIGDDGDGTMEDVVKGVEWVLAKKKAEGGHWVINLSLGGDEAANAEREAFERAIAEGVIVVAASGNASIPSTPAPVSFPAAYPNVISVGAVNELGEYASFSNEGPELEFVAPGVKVISLDLHDDKYLSYVRTEDDQILVTRHMNGSKPASVTGEYVDCGFGTASDFPPAVNGKIAVIQRGGDTFAVKVRRAKEAGAAAVIIYNNNADSGIVWTLLSDDDPDTKNYVWPVAIGMTMADGQALLAKGTGRITIGYDPDDYSAKTGTSMATPHVTGAVALLWALAPDATPAQITNALIATAKDLGPAGKDDKTGYGLIDLYAAAKMLAPSAFVDTNTPGYSTGRRFLKRRSH
jgi:subtilisin family serine protease